MKVEYERGYYTYLNILFRKKCSCFFQEETKLFDNEWTDKRFWESLYFTN